MWQGSAIEFQKQYLVINQISGQVPKYVRFYGAYGADLSPICRALCSSFGGCNAVLPTHNKGRHALTVCWPQNPIREDYNQNPSDNRHHQNFRSPELDLERINICLDIFGRAAWKMKNRQNRGGIFFVLYLE